MNKNNKNKKLINKMIAKNRYWIKIKKNLKKNNFKLLKWEKFKINRKFKFNKTIFLWVFWKLKEIYKKDFSVKKMKKISIQMKLYSKIKFKIKK
jgi:hypothetical protein